MRRLVLAVATLELFVLPVSTQTADEIITKYVNKIGGAEQIHAIKTLRRTGKLTLAGGFEAVLVHENKRPDMVRQDMTLQGMTGVIAYDGHSGWKIEPWQGKKDAEPLGEEELKEMLEEADFDGPLIDYQQKGNKIESDWPGAGRGYRRPEAQGHAQERRRSLLLHGHGLLRSHQDRDQARRARRGARI